MKKDAELMKRIRAIRDELLVRANEFALWGEPSLGKLDSDAAEAITILLGEEKKESRDA